MRLPVQRLIDEKARIGNGLAKVDAVVWKQEGGGKTHGQV